MVTQTAPNRNRTRTDVPADAWDYVDVDTLETLGRYWRTDAEFGWGYCLNDGPVRWTEGSLFDVIDGFYDLLEARTMNDTGFSGGYENEKERIADVQRLLQGGRTGAELLALHLERMVGNAFLEGADDYQRVSSTERMVGGAS